MRGALFVFTCSSLYLINLQILVVPCGQFVSKDYKVKILKHVRENEVRVIMFGAAFNKF